MTMDDTRSAAAPGRRWRAPGKLQHINLGLYDELGTGWYEAQDDPIALLRAEQELTGPWLVQRIGEHCATSGQAYVLDVGCGGGLTSNRLAAAGMRVVGVDLSVKSLDVARQYDKTRTVEYRAADAYALPFAESTFDVVVMNDFLEHVEEPRRVVAEAARVLRPGGLYYFHTFNRNLFAWFLVIKLVELAMPKAQENIHLLRMFIKPEEMRAYCVEAGLRVTHMHGTKPNLWSRAFLRGLMTGRIPPDFGFSFTRSLRVAYSGLAVKAEG